MSQIDKQGESKTDTWTGYGLVGSAPEVIRVNVGLREKPDMKTLVRKITRMRTLKPPRTALIVRLQWLDEAKKNLALPVEFNGKAFKDPETQTFFLDRCAELTAALRPDCFDLGPECNFYLREHPQDFTEFVKLCKAAKERIQKVSPDTKVMVSFQYELWQGWKKRLKNLCGIAPEEPLNTQLGLANQFEGIVDYVGVSTDPSVVFAKPAEVPLDYYYRLANATQKRLIFTEIGWPQKDGGREQAEFIETFARRIYWLDPLAVIWAGDSAERARDDGRTGYELAGVSGEESVKAWRDLLGWRLFAQRPQPGPPIRLKPAKDGF